jgi:hypothetical protein
MMQSQSGWLRSTHRSHHCPPKPIPKHAQKIFSQSQNGRERGDPPPERTTPTRISKETGRERLLIVPTRPSLVVSGPFSCGHKIQNVASRAEIGKRKKSAPDQESKHPGGRFDNLPSTSHTHTQTPEPRNSFNKHFFDYIFRHDLRFQHTLYFLSV